LTIPRYEDRKSRLVVEKALRQVLEKSKEFLKEFVELVHQLALKLTKKNSDG